MTLDSLRPHPGSRHGRKRIGRGQGSGHGKTACKGQKGQRSRSGASIPPGFEGGQMPLYRQLPKRGFKNPFKKAYAILNLADLAKIGSKGVIDLALLKAQGLVCKRYRLLKILGDGEINQAVTVRVDAVSEAAKSKIEAAGGQIEIITKKDQEAKGV
ncbi:MAG: 50S ribosomal protein L15 [Nitrospiraceae bacterium]|nr:50S ribosomal protein L15 [Nitrospiraceae bacterium]